ncbi:hypothetical protein HH308_18845 [Gordonia sp. TBRC 11910]|uniref:Uncharacterized protein n=1 Tax=Gordonia asplenii TaxID=2725283 RepID=A0A848KXC9_9ACTN|nr:hypothetical protein [Gordonia asplenii]NMO03276.1 hypothetical protein [Gordonia asplenii]
MAFGMLNGAELAGRAGAAFPIRLARASPTNGARSVHLDGWTTTISDAGDLVTTCTEALVAVDRVEAVARRRANEGLDYLCAVEFIDVVLSKALDDFVTWGTDPDTESEALRVTAILSMKFELTFNTKVINANGVEVPPPPRDPKPHEAMRFMRMARTATSRHDAYVNLSLTLESLLHELHPHVRKGKGRKGESEWFKEALAVADQKVPIAQLAPPSTPNPIQWIYDHIYGEFRSGLMHAKDDFQLPGDEHRAAEFEALFAQLWRYVAALMQATLDTPGRGSTTSDAMWTGLGKHHFSGMYAAVTNDANATGITESFAPSGGGIQQLPLGEVAYPSHGLLLCLATCSAGAVRPLGPLTRIGSVSTDGRAWTASELPMPLIVGDAVDEFQVLVGVRHANEGGIVTQFDN